MSNETTKTEPTTEEAGRVDTIVMCEHADEVETAKLIAVIKVLRQTVLEVRHAQDQGSRWYTKGDSGLFQQVRLHLNRADVAIKSVESALDT